MVDGNDRATLELTVAELSDLEWLVGEALVRACWSASEHDFARYEALHETLMARCAETGVTAWREARQPAGPRFTPYGPWFNPAP